LLQLTASPKEALPFNLIFTVSTSTVMLQNQLTDVLATVIYAEAEKIIASDALFLLASRGTPRFLPRPAAYGI
jgi:hypothetical protein